MELETTLVERVIHLALFVAGGIAVAVAAVAVLERVAGGDPASDERRTVRAVHIGAAVALFGLLFAAERIYHAMR